MHENPDNASLSNWLRTSKFPFTNEVEQKILPENLPVTELKVLGDQTRKWQKLQTYDRALNRLLNHTCPRRCFTNSPAVELQLRNCEIQ